MHRFKQYGSSHFILPVLLTAFALVGTVLLSSNSKQTPNKSLASNLGTTFSLTNTLNIYNVDGVVVTPPTAGVATAWVGTGGSVADSYLLMNLNTLSALPKGAVITSAKLTVTASKDQWITTGFAIYGVKSPQLPSQNIKPSTYIKTLAFKSVNENVRWKKDTSYSFDVTSVLQELVANVDLKNVGLMVKGAGPQWGRKFILVGANQTPTLTVEYEQPTPTPTPTSYPKASSCISVSVTGATYAGVAGGKPLYFVSSGGSASFHANTTPRDGAVSWKVASASSLLPNHGSFSVNNAPNTVYTAPMNTSGSDQGVEIRGDVSEYPDPWVYCPPFTIGVHSN